MREHRPCTARGECPANYTTAGNPEPDCPNFGAWSQLVSATTGGTPAPVTLSSSDHKVREGTDVGEVSVTSGSMEVGCVTQRGQPRPCSTVLPRAEQYKRLASSTETPPQTGLPELNMPLFKKSHVGPDSHLSFVLTSDVGHFCRTRIKTAARPTIPPQVATTQSCPVPVPTLTSWDTTSLEGIGVQNPDTIPLSSLTTTRQSTLDRVTLIPTPNLPGSVERLRPPLVM